MQERIIVLRDNVDILSPVEFALTLLSHNYLVFIDIYEALNWLSLSNEIDARRNRVVVFDYFNQVDLKEHVDLVHQLIARKKTNDKIMVCLNESTEECNLKNHLSRQVISAVHMTRCGAIRDDIQKLTGGSPPGDEVDAVCDVPCGFGGGGADENDKEPNLQELKNGEE